MKKCMGTTPDMLAMVLITEAWLMECAAVGGERRFLSRKEKIEMLEEYGESLKSELEGVEEALKELEREP